MPLQHYEEPAIEDQRMQLLWAMQELLEENIAVLIVKASLAGKKYRKTILYLLYLYLGGTAWTGFLKDSIVMQKVYRYYVNHATRLKHKQKIVKGESMQKDERIAKAKEEIKSSLESLKARRIEKEIVKVFKETLPFETCYLSERELAEAHAKDLLNFINEVIKIKDSNDGLYDEALLEYTRLNKELK